MGDERRSYGTEILARNETVAPDSSGNHSLGIQ